MDMTHIQMTVAWADIILADMAEGLKTMGLTFLLMIAVAMAFWIIRVLRRRMKERDRK